MAQKKTLLEIVNMSSDELLEYYNSRQFIYESESCEEEFLGEMTQDELVSKYRLISDADTQEIIENKFHLNGYSVKNNK